MDAKKTNLSTLGARTKGEDTINPLLPAQEAEVLAADGCNQNMDATQPGSGRSDRAIAQHGNVSELGAAITVLEKRLQILAGLKQCQDRLFQMTQHIMKTFHYASPAFNILSKSDAQVEEYLIASKDVALAATYLIVLLNISMVLGRLFILLVGFLNWVWLPIKLLLYIFRWVFL